MNPDLELTLPARAENVAVVRHAFGGLGDVLDVPDQTLSDIKLAVTEACTNVVVHAYPDREGELGVRALVDDRRLTVVVVDTGRGILPRPDSPGLGLGLPLIATLAESLELGTGAGDETEVRMTFDLDAASRDARAAPRMSEASQATTVRVRCGPLVGAVLGRVVGMLAARAQCPIDRLDDALLLTDAVAAHAPNHVRNGTVARRRADDDRRPRAARRRARARRGDGAPARRRAARGRERLRAGGRRHRAASRRRGRRARPAPAVRRMTDPAALAGAYGGHADRRASPSSPSRSATATELERFYVDVLGLEVSRREDDRTWLACGEHARLGLWLPGREGVRRRGRPPRPLRVLGRAGRLDDLVARLARARRRAPRTGGARRRRPVALRRGPGGQRRRGLGLLRAAARGAARASRPSRTTPRRQCGRVRGGMPPEFSLKQEPIDADRHVVAVTGEIDLFTAPELKSTLADAVEAGHTRIVVDLTQTTFLDSTALGVLIGAVKRLRSQDGVLTIVNTDPNIAKTFEITGLDQIFTIRHDPRRGRRRPRRPRRRLALEQRQHRLLDGALDGGAARRRPRRRGRSSAPSRKRSKTRGSMYEARATAGVLPR